jgi:hypothetical protein
MVGVFGKEIFKFEWDEFGNKYTIVDRITPATTIRHPTIAHHHHNHCLRLEPPNGFLQHVQTHHHKKAVQTQTPPINKPQNTTTGANNWLL